MQISQRIATARPLATTAMHGRVETLRAAGEPVIDFSIAISHFPAPASVREQLADMVLRTSLPYTTVGGALPLRAQLADKVGRENRIDAQAATGAAFASGEPHELVADYRMRRDLVVDTLKPSAWIRMLSPDSGPYLWCDVRALGCDTVAFADQLLAEHRVAIMPGDALGSPGWIRIGFIADDVATLRRGVDAIRAFGIAVAAATVRLPSL